VLDVLERIRRVLDFKISIATLIEIWLWTAVPYLTVGLVWAAFNPVFAQRIEDQYLSWLPAGREVAAFVDSALLWPLMMFAPGICPT
jgi:hypothetical protein